MTMHFRWQKEILNIIYKGKVKFIPLKGRGGL
jgi:hypothetical protein